MAAEAVKDGVRQFTAGGSAGLVEVCLMHPLDLIKTRLQVAQHDKGMMDCVRKTFRNEGFLGFYKGILPPILAETPKRATKFFTFEQYKKIFSHPSVSPAISLSMAGLFCGFTEAIVICPFEVVKVRLQSERGVSLMQQKSTAAVAREIIKTDGLGLNGLYRGTFNLHRIFLKRVGFLLLSKLLPLEMEGSCTFSDYWGMISFDDKVDTISTLTRIAKIA
uniref:Mitochondrial 2-oxodicarboxylate carrier n=1 Tax=Haemonchus contortus TaxID=6289 RepID=W6NRA6_HAECO